MPYTCRDPMRQAEHADNSHFRSTKGGTMGGRDKGLRQLSGAEVIGPAEE